MASTTLFSKHIGKCMKMARRPEFWPFARYHALLFPQAPQIALPCCRPISSARPLSTLASTPPVAAQFRRRGRRPPPHRPLPRCSPISPVRSSSYAWPAILPAHHLQFLSARPPILPPHHLQLHNCDGEVHPRHEKLQRRGAPDMRMGWVRTSSELRATTGVLVSYMPP